MEFKGSELVEPILLDYFDYLNKDYLKYMSAMIEDECIGLSELSMVKNKIDGIIGCFDREMTEEKIIKVCEKIYQAMKVKNVNSDEIGLTLLEKPVLISQMKKRVVQSQKNVLPTRDDLKQLKQEKKRKVKLNTQSIVDLTPVVSQRSQKVGEDSSFTGQIQFNNFDISFSNLSLLEDACFHISKSRRYGLIGKNGLGKSTLLKMISSRQLCIPSNMSLYHVEQEVIGDDTSVIDAVLKSDVVRQSLLNELNRINSSDGDDNASRTCDIMEQLNVMESDKAPARAAYILNGLGFDNVSQSHSTKQFSGGWRMRISLAQALFIEPTLLLLDEPSNMLDMRAILWLEEYLCSWKSTMIIVSHDKEFINHVCTDILHLTNKKIVQYAGTYDSYMSSLAERRKTQQREYDAQMEKRQHIQAFIDKFRYNAKRAALVQSRIKYLNNMPVLIAPEKEGTVKFRFPETSQFVGNLLELVDVQFSFNEKTVLLDNINVSITAGSRICMVGPNGAGKTTILKLLLNKLQPTKGERICNRKLRISYFTQHHVDQLNLRVSSLEFLRDSHPGKSAEDYRRVLGSFGITGDTSLRPLSVLSGGQKSRVAFANMSMIAPNVIIMDEPTNHLDSESIDALCDALKFFKGSAILVLHDERMIRHCCNELWLCDKGTLKSLNGGITEYKKIVHDEMLK
ncbi:hypothetical protein A3Q56_07204 [Intoshia linei]|uniref:ABC transporter domain-containing protein n=1 Tax=Intoshia linei TaxID=1819745 RepID=A0A177ATE0_9BILA|nr:hypothetical protein A3Q56_07204 [Intoshia linei]